MAERTTTAHALLLSSCLTLTGLQAAAQQTWLPVGDLLCEQAPREAYLGSLCGNAIPGGRRIDGERLLGGLGVDEDGGCVDFGLRGHFAAAQLVALLGHLGSENADDELALHGRFLAVPRAKAELAGQLLADLRKALPPRLQIRLRLVQRSGQRETVLLARTGECDPGRLSVLSAVRRHQAVVDYGVEIAQASSIADPLCLEARDGVMVAMRPQLAPAADRGLLELVVRCARPGKEAKIDTGYAAVGAIDRLPLDIAELARVVPIRPGSKLALAWSSGQDAYELQLDVDWRLPEAARPDARELGIFTMRGDLQGFRSLSIPGPLGADPEPLLAEAHDDPWAQIVEHAGEGAEWTSYSSADDTAQPFVAVDGSRRTIAQAVSSWFDVRGRVFTGAIACFAVPRGTAWPDDGRMPQGATALGEAQLQQADATWSAATVREESSVLCDWGVEVAQAARVADPRLARLSTGLVLNTHTFGDRIEVDGELSRVIDPGRERLLLSAPMFGPERTVDGEPKPANRVLLVGTVAMIADEVNIEHPVVAAAPIKFTRELAKGGQAVWRSSADLVLGAGQDLVVVVKRTE